MAHSYHHALSSAKKHGGIPDDYSMVEYQTITLLSIIGLMRLNLILPILSIELFVTIHWAYFGQKKSLV